MVKIQTYLIPTFLVTTEVSVTIDEVPRPTGCIFLQSIVYQQCSGISVADMKMLRFLTHITTRKLKKMNISFVKLEDNHKLHKYELSKSDENRKNRKPTFVDCADCVDFELHIKTATEARKDIVRKRIGNGLTTRKLYLLICRRLSCCRGFLD